MNYLERKITVKKVIPLIILLSIVSLVIGHKGYFPIPIIKKTKHYLTNINLYWLTSNVVDNSASNVVDNSGKYNFELVNAKAPFAPRDGAGAIFHQGKLFLIGGWNPSDKINFPRITSNDVWASYDYGYSWKKIKENTYTKGFPKNSESDFEGRHTAGYVSLGKYMYILGGDANQGYHINNIYRSADGIKWELINKSPPWAPRALHLSFVFNKFIYVIGGQTMPRFTPLEPVGEFYYRDIWKSKDGIKWTRVHPVGPLWQPRGGYGGSGFVLNNEVYVIGGFNYDSLINHQRNIHTDVWKTKNLKNWERVTSQAAWSKKGGGFQYHDTAIYDGKLWLIGGNKLGHGNTNEVWFSSNGKDWEQYLHTPFKPTHATSVWSTPEGIIIGAGNSFSKEIWKISKIKSQKTR